MLPNIERYLDDTQRRAFAKAKAEGEAEGEAKAILRILEKRGIAVTAAHRDRILACSDIATLDGWFDRAMTVSVADELFS